LVSGSHDGKVRLWSLSLQTVSSPPSLGYGLSGTAERNSHPSKDKEAKRQKALAEFIEVQSPVLCVNQVVTWSASGMSSTDSTSDSSTCSLVVAAGSMDGTVAVWSSDIDMVSGTLRATDSRLLFCHQLRPSER
jgi:WD40 repeat protein